MEQQETEVKEDACETEAQRESSGAERREATSDPESLSGRGAVHDPQEKHKEAQSEDKKAKDEAMPSSNESRAACTKDEACTRSDQAKDPELSSDSVQEKLECLKVDDETSPVKNTDTADDGGDKKVNLQLSSHSPVTGDQSSTKDEKVQQNGAQTEDSSDPDEDKHLEEIKSPVAPLRKTSFSEDPKESFGGNYANRARRDSIERLVGEDVSWNFECHFIWSRGRISSTDADRQIDKWERMERQDQIRFSSQQDQHSLLMVMAFWYCEKKNYPKAEQLILSAEKLCSDFPGKLHVCLANKAFISLRAGRLKEAFDTKEKVPSYENLDGSNLAAVSGMKGDFERQLRRGSVSSALKYYRTATKMDPMNSLWNIKAGTALAHIRRNRQERVSEEELAFMLKAAQLGGFSLQLATTLKDMAAELQANPFAEENEVMGINQQLSNVYKSLLRKGNLSAEAYTECGKGLASLPEPLKDEVLAEECFKSALEQCPQCCRANIAYAQFLEFNVGKPKEALHYYEIALANGEENKYFIIPHIIRIRTEMHQTYDPEFEWETYFIDAPDSTVKVREFRNNAEYIWKVDPKRALDLYYRAARVEHDLGLYPQMRRSFPWEMQEDGVRLRVSEENQYYDVEDRMVLLENHLKLQDELEKLHAIEQARARNYTQ